MAFIPSPTLKAAWLTKTEASTGFTEHVTAFASPMATSPSDGDIMKGGGTSHRKGAATYIRGFPLPHAQFVGHGLQLWPTAVTQSKVGGRRVADIW